MSTNALISKQNADGSIRTVYAHWDGYPSYMGKMLALNYADEAKVDALLDEGNISSLEENVGEKHDFEDYDWFCENKATSFYGRDREDDDQNAVLYANREEYNKGTADFSCVEYEYMWIDGVWHYSKRHAEWVVIDPANLENLPG